MLHCFLDKSLFQFYHNLQAFFQEFKAMNCLFLHSQKIEEKDLEQILTTPCWLAKLSGLVLLKGLW